MWTDLIPAGRPAPRLDGLLHSTQFVDRAIYGIAELGFARAALAEMARYDSAVRTNHQPTVRSEPTFTEAARRAQIIDCAIDAIGELGFARASLAEIARRARISKSVVSYYFSSKDELIEQVVQAIYAAGAAFMIPRIESAPSVAAALRALITSNVEFLDTHRRDIRALTEIIANWRDAKGAQRYDSAREDQGVRDIATLLRAGQERSEFREFSAGVMATAIRASIDALPWRLRADPDLDVAAYGEELADIFDRATATPRQTKSSTKEAHRA